VSIGVKFFGAGAIFLFSFLLVGLLLPGTWSAEREIVIQAPPGAVFPYLDNPDRWGDWTAWPDANAARRGPERGAGATRSWNDPEFGDGVFTIVASRPEQEVEYRVEVQNGAMVTLGRLILNPEEGGTRVSWREEGDFGWNPLMGYLARSMDRYQGREFEKGLEQLRSVVEEEAGPPPSPGGTGRR